MALAYGVATGLGPAAGMYGAIAVGFCASIFGGTPARIAYPSAAMTVAMMIVLAQHARTPSEAFTIVMLAGVIQIALGLLRVGRFVNYTPYSMIAGFTSGIGLMIIIQTLPFLGAEPADSKTRNSFLSSLALSGRGARTWRPARYYPSMAGGCTHAELARGRYRRGIARDLRFLAAPARPLRAGTAGRAGRRNGRRGAVVAGRAHDW